MTDRLDHLRATYRALYLEIVAAPDDAARRAIAEREVGNDSLCDDGDGRANLIDYVCELCHDAGIHVDDVMPEEYEARHGFPESLPSSQSTRETRHEQCKIPLG